MPRIPLLMLILTLLPIAAVPAQAESPSNKLNARQAVERSLPYLEKEGLAWMETRKCVACHHAAFLLWSHHEAKSHGVAVDLTKLNAWSEQALKLHLANEKNFEKNKNGGVETAHLLLGGVVPVTEEKAVETCKTMATTLLNAQREDGHWNYEGQGQRRPANEANETTTMWASLALASLSDKDEAADKGRERALTWAKKNTTGEGNEAAALRLLIEQKFGDAAKAKELAKALAVRQNADGGWSWSKDFPSDSFATGQSLYALAKAGVPVDDPAIQKAVKYLLDSQRPDGSWYAPSKKPEKKDNPIAVYWGTAWATIGLAQALPADEKYDVIIRGGTVYDGSGKAPKRADVALKGDRIVAVGDLAGAEAKTVVDAKGLAVAPGFINMLSWSTDSLLYDGRGQSEIRQGVTTEIMGEGWSWGPVNDVVKKRMKSEQIHIQYDIDWTTLSQYLLFLERKGVSHNVASFVGATTVREVVLGNDNKKPTPAQLEQMKRLVEIEMRDGALGIGTALEYAPSYYADTEELIELCKVAAKYQGKYITHMRSEGARLLEGIDEVIRISREAKIPAEIYHFKAAGKEYWPKMSEAIAKIEAARRDGLTIRANMYCYTAGGTGLDACIPPWAQDGGAVAMRRRLRDPEQRKRAVADIKERKKDTPNFYLDAGSPENILLVGFRTDNLKPLTGKTLAAVAKERGKDPVETLIDLLLEDESRIDSVYFTQSEDVVRKLVTLPWVSFGSDEASQAPEGPFLKMMPHPRAYGNFARLLGKYVRDEKLLTLEEAIRKLSHQPATNLGLDKRGLLQEGYFADVVVFDPKTIADKATFEKPHQYAVGMRHVFVNGIQVLKDGEHTNAKPGRALWGPGKVQK